MIRMYLYSEQRKKFGGTPIETSACQWPLHVRKRPAADEGNLINLTPGSGVPSIQSRALKELRKVRGAPLLRRERGCVPRSFSIEKRK